MIAALLLHSACSWNRTARAPRPQLGAAPTAGERPSLTYRLTLQAEAPDMAPVVRGALERSDRFGSVSESGASGLHADLDFHWHVHKGRGVAMMTACLLTLNFLPCWGTVRLRATAKAARAGEEPRIYRVEHAYRRWVWLAFALPLAAAFSTDGGRGAGGGGTSHLGADDRASMERVTEEAVRSLLARMERDGLLEARAP